MNVQDTPCESFDERSAEYAHEARENNEVRRMDLYSMRQQPVVVATVGHSATRHAHGFDAGSPRTIESVRVGAVTDYGGQVQLELSRGSSIDQCLQIATVARHEDDSAHSFPVVQT